jgi:hypothetical protein
MMIITALEAIVPAERAAALEAAYEELGRRALPDGLVRSHLVRSVNSPDLWRLETTWRDRQALEAMRGQGTPPAGLILFRSVGVEPSVGIFEVVGTIEAQAS